jgi:MFS family permease
MTGEIFGRRSGGVVLIALVGLAICSVPLAGGRLGRLLEVRFRWAWMVPLALTVQTTGLFAPGLPSGVRAGAQVAAYLLAGLVVAANLRVPGLWLLGLGGGCNLAAIAANKGVMPAAPGALALAGRTSNPDQFANSMAVSRPHLAFLGDVFALPDPIPLHNVFSIGDVCLVLGAVIVLHRVAGSRLLPRGDGEFTAVLTHPAFVRLWSAQIVSNLGDWSYTLAVAALVTERTHDPRLLALLFAAQVAPAALVGTLVGPLIDRARRDRLMIVADLARAGAVASLLLGGLPSPLHLCLIGACLGTFSSVFQPSMQASIPNVVARHQVVAANAIVSATYHIAIMTGPALGGLLIATAGSRVVFALNALSFVVSALLIAKLHLPRPPQAQQPTSPVQDLIQGLRYASTTPLIRAIFLVVGLVVMAAATKAPLESLFVLKILDRGPQTYGLLTAAWGAGMLLGSIAAPAATRRWSRERLFAVSIATVGLAVLSVSQASSVATILGAWLLGGTANALGNICYESLLQERTPDALRGRVMAASEALLQTSLLTGALLAGWIGNHLGVRPVYLLAGVLLLLAAGLARLLLPGPTPTPDRNAVDEVPQVPAAEPTS